MDNISPYVWVGLQNPPSTTEQIVYYVAKFHSLSLDDIKLRSKKHIYSRPRQVAHYILYQSGFNQSEIADYFGLERTTICNSVSQVQGELRYNIELRQMIARFITKPSKINL